MAVTSALSWRRREYSWNCDEGWFRTKRRTIRSLHADWLIDGVPLRRMIFPDPTVEVDGVTPVCNPDAQPDMACEYLRTLLGTATTDTWRFDDGRVALLCCPVDFDLDCGTLTAELELTAEHVSWRRFGYQVSYQAFEEFDTEHPRTADVLFDRSQYEGVLHGLLRELAV